jgi:hypothetical protein
MAQEPNSLANGNVAYYPEDLGSGANAHYVKLEIYLVETENTNLVQGDAPDKTKFSASGQKPRSQSADGEVRSKQNSVVKYTKLEEMIALPMPDSIVTDHSTIWSKSEGGLISGAISLADAFQDQGRYEKLDMAKSAIIGAGSGVANIMSQLGLDGAETNLKLLTKRASNPRNEFLFDGVNNRSFNLQWKFIPKSHYEAVSLRFILEKLKLYMYPELEQATNGAFYMFPGMFDITFMHGAYENEWLYRTSTCALTNMIINYSGAGVWIATDFSGAPFSIEVTLQFTETEFLHRARFKNWANPDGVAR